MTNPVRACIACGQTDDHPRHVISLIDSTEVPWHMDCHALATGCAICMNQLADAPAKAKGDSLREHLVTTPARDNTEEAS